MPRANISGEKFAMLTVAECMGRRKGGTFWKCVCDCGGTITTRLDSLRDGVTRSCGCLSAASLVGQTFGRLTVIRRNGTLPKRGALWLCQCQCGSIRTINSNSLLKGNSRSCGCLKRDLSVSNGHKRVIDLIGQTFGWLTVNARGRVHAKGQSSIWRCTCICGTIKEVRSICLRSGMTISCGCAIATAQSRPPLTSARARANGATTTHTRRALKAKSGGSFTSVQIDALYARQKDRCAEPSCRVALNGKFHRDHRVPLILGGSNGIRNIQLLCAPCNRRKRAKSPEVWARENGRLI